jgi:uncharacterized protein (TIGR00251 family)
VILTVRVIPRAARSAIAGSRDNALLVRLTAPPVDGAANAELIRVLADALDVPKRNITLLSGDRARLKRVKITGLTDDEVARKLSCIPQTS